MQRKILVVGIGNRNCGDDAAGPEVVDCLNNSPESHIEAVTVKGDPAYLIGAMKGHEFVVIVNAILTHYATGALHVFDASKIALPEELFSGFSTHAFGLSNAIEIARALGELPARLVVLGIEGERFEPGDPLSPRVRVAIVNAATWILDRASAYDLPVNRSKTP